MRRIVLTFLVVMLSTGMACAAGTRRLTPKQIEQIKQAIEDEIYDYGYYNQFYEIGENTGTPQHWVSRVHLFIDPIYNSTDGHGEVLYKLMPFGLIYRLFYAEDIGTIRLDGNPQNRFPITQPSHQTVFMDEEDVCRYIKTWTKASIIVDTEPTKLVIQSASQRQKNRTGFSDWEYRQSDQDQPKK